MGLGGLCSPKQPSRWKQGEPGGPNLLPNTQRCAAQEEELRALPRLV